jgi:hypothetical protein
MALRVRRNKLVKNDSETRLNRILKDFKSLDTYVDISSFLKDMNVVNHGAGAVLATDSTPTKKLTAKRNKALEGRIETPWQISARENDSIGWNLLERVNR